MTNANAVLESAIELQSSSPSADRTAALVNFIAALNRRKLLPEAAMAALQALGRESPAYGLKLVWDHEPATDRYNYCLLASTEHQTISIAANQHNELPWSLRGGVRFDSEVLANINGNPLNVSDAITYIDAVLDKTGLLTEIVDLALLSAEARHYAIQVPEEHIAAATARYFAARGLDDAGQQNAWLAERGLSRERHRLLMRDAIAKRAIERDLATLVPAAPADQLPQAMAASPVAYMRIPAQLIEAARQYLSEHPQQALGALAAHLAECCDFVDAPPLEFRRMLNVDLAEFGAPAHALVRGALVIGKERPSGVEILQILGAPDTPSPGQAEARGRQRALRRWYQNQRSRAKIDWNWGSARFGAFALRQAPSHPG